MQLEFGGDLSINRAMSAVVHLDYPELEAGLGEILRSPADHGRVDMLVVRPGRDLRELRSSVELTPEAGMVGDRWLQTNTRRLPDGRINPDTQLTLMNSRAAALIAGPQDRWPLAGDNLVVDFDLSVENLPVGKRLQIGDAELEVSAEPHTGCSKFSKRFGLAALKFVNSPEGRRLRLRGVYVWVVRAGSVAISGPIKKL